MATIKRKTHNNKFQQGCGKLEHLRNASGIVNGATTMENSMEGPQKF